MSFGCRDGEHKLVPKAVRQTGGRQCDSRSGLLWNWLLEEKRICHRIEWLCWAKKGSSSPTVHNTQCCQKDATKEYVQRNFSCDSLFLLLLGSLRNIYILRVRVVGTRCLWKSLLLNSCGSSINTCRPACQRSATWASRFPVQLHVPAHSAAVARQDHFSPYPLHRYSHGNWGAWTGQKRNVGLDDGGMLQYVSAEQLISTLCTDTEICCVCRNSGS